MFEYFLRKFIFNTFSEEDQDTIMLLKYRVKMDVTVRLLLLILEVLLIWIFATFMLINNLNIIIVLVIAITCCIFTEIFKTKYSSKLQNFYKQLSRWLYVHRYVLRGKAISKRDFYRIRNKNQELYEFIVNLKTNGYCYSICFDILECLAKGKILFVAIKISSKSSHYKYNNNYTMHVLYVFDGWCYDTYSEMQYPLEEVLERSKAKIYKSFSYKDIQEKTYYEFKEENLAELQKWCEENDCYQKW